MAKFCTKCGRPLAEGEVCNCQSGQSPAAGVAQENAQAAVAEAQENAQTQAAEAQEAVQAAAEQAQKNAQEAASAVPQGQFGQQAPQGQFQQAQGQYQQAPQGQFQQAQGQYQQAPQGQFQQGPQGQYQQAQGQFQQGYYQQGQAQPNAQMAAATQYAKTFAQNLIGLLKNPVTTGRSLTQVADIKVSMIYIVLQGIFSALFGTIVTGGVLKLIRTLSGGYGDDYFKLPGFRIFMITLLASVVLNLALAGLLLLGHMILGQKTTYQRMLSAVSVRSALAIPSIVVALLFSFISKPFGVVFFFLSAIWGFVAMIMVVDAGIEERKKDISALVMAVVILIFLALLYFAITKLGLYYLPNQVREVINNPSDLFSELIGELY